jgi:hypothetical protein
MQGYYGSFFYQLFLHTPLKPASIKENRQNYGWYCSLPFVVGGLLIENEYNFKT